MNTALSQGGYLRERNYVLRPNPDHGYWVNFSSGQLASYVARCGDAFNIVIAGSAEVEGDFYAIPYPVLKAALADEYRSTDKTGRSRWVASIKQHQMRVGRYPIPIDVGAYYGCQAVLANPGTFEPADAGEVNDYAIENRKIEIQQRQKQSVFRRRVLRNFEGQCCLSGITENELLVASHIIPWCKRISTRLDPSNGLLLYCLYDRLFDVGYISFDNDLRVMVCESAAQCSLALRSVLVQLAGKKARHPKKWAIKTEFLDFHRTEIFQRHALTSAVKSVQFEAH